MLRSTTPRQVALTLFALVRVTQIPEAYYNRRRKHHLLSIDHPWKPKRPLWPDQPVRQSGVAHQLSNRYQRELVKNVLKVIAALALSLVVGMQFLATFPFIPEGNRVLVIGSHIAYAAFGIGALSLLYLISPSNRTFGHFLKAFVAFATVTSLVQCSPWIKKFNGPDHWVESIDGLVSAEVPSDWARMTKSPDGANLAVADWAGTAIVTVTSEVPAESNYTQQQLELGAQSLEADMLSSGAQRIEPVACGSMCMASRYHVDQGGAKRRVVMGLKVTGRRVLVLMAAGLKPEDQEHDAEIAEILASVRTSDAKTK